jgi:hypothetical protein
VRCPAFVVFRPGEQPIDHTSEDVELRIAAERLLFRGGGGRPSPIEVNAA